MNHFHGGAQMSYDVTLPPAYLAALVDLYGFQQQVQALFVKYPNHWIVSEGGKPSFWVLVALITVHCTHMRRLFPTVFQVQRVLSRAIITPLVVETCKRCSWD
jgi:hypothetical protein